jgi:hypothetical protein
MRPAKHFLSWVVSHANLLCFFRKDTGERAEAGAARNRASEFILCGDFRLLPVPIMPNAKAYGMSKIERRVYWPICAISFQLRRCKEYIVWCDCHQTAAN